MILINKLRVKLNSLANKIILGKWSNIFSRTIESIEISKPEIIEETIQIRKAELEEYKYPENFPLMFRRKRFFPDRKLFKVTSCGFIKEIGLVRSVDGFILLESFGSFRKLLHWNNVLPFLYGYIKNLEISAPVYYIRSANFYHFLLEEIPSFLYAKDNFPNLQILVSPRDKPSYIEEILELILPCKMKDKVKMIKNNITVENLVFTQRDPFSGGVHENDIDILNKHILPVIDFQNDDENNERIYISRKKTNKRNIKNEQEIENLLQKFNFDILYMEDLTFSEQVKKTKNADVIIGPHGAGLSHIVWKCNKKKSLLEIFPSNVNNDCFASIAKTKGDSYYYFRCKNVNGNEILDLLNLEKWLNKQL